MTKLELAGALFVRSLVRKDVPEPIIRLLDAALEDITEELDDAQFELWNAAGTPDVTVTLVTYE